MELPKYVFSLLGIMCFLHGNSPKMTNRQMCGHETMIIILLFYNFNSKILLLIRDGGLKAQWVVAVAYHFILQYISKLFPLNIQGK